MLRQLFHPKITHIEIVVCQVFSVILNHTFCSFYASFIEEKYYFRFPCYIQGLYWKQV